MDDDTNVEVATNPAIEKPVLYQLSAQQLYETLPLPPYSHCIRLLDIDPLPQVDGPSTPGQIRGQLRTVDLQQRPSFLSLSYVWGAKESTAYFVDLPSQGCNIGIAPNCYQALKHIRDRLGSFSIWVDAICINQENDQERESQIALMQEIYSLADTVYIWLGPGNEVSDKAMDYLNRRASLGRRMPLTFLAAMDPAAKLRAYRNYKRQAWADVRARCGWPPADRADVKLDEVLDREWIHRSWTFQEFVLATNMTVLCGTKVISWEDLAGALCSEPGGSGSRVAASLPVSEVVLMHWRSIIDLWFNLPRSRLSNANTDKNDSQKGNSFRQQLLTLWKNRKLPWAFRFIYAATVMTLHLTISGAWGFASYHIMVNGKKAISKIKDNGHKVIAWYFLIVAWICATYIVFRIAYGIQCRWHFITHGWKQGWLFRNHLDSADYRALDAIRGALRERKSTDPRDRAYALHGVLIANGATPSAADYSWSVGKTYLTLVKDLLSYNPAAISIVMDASSRGQFDRPTWVPNWRLSVPSAWLTSNHRLGLSDSCTPFRENPSFSISGSQLHIPGTSKGVISFQHNMNRTRRDNQTDPLEMNLHRMLLWWAHVRKEVPKKDPNDRPLSSLFAILDGMSPKRGPTGVYHEGGTDSEGGYYSGHWEEYPLVQGLYDFRSWAAAFQNWTALHGILEAIIPLSANTAEELSGHVSTLLATVKANQSAHQYLIRLHNKLVNDKRSLFVLSSGLIGTGPPDIKIDDEIYRLAGVPLPMALRRVSGSNNFRVVGAVMVHGLMHAEGFKESALSQVVLV